MTKQPRGRTFNIRFSDEEWAHLNMVCAWHGLSRAGLLRMLIKHEATGVVVGVARPDMTARTWELWQDFVALKKSRRGAKL